MRRTVLGALLIIAALLTAPSPVLRAALPASIGSPCIRADTTAIVWDMASLYQVDPILLSAIIEVESGWVQTARSKKGAVGLTQILPSTAKGLNIINYECTVPNIAAGAKYLSILGQKFPNRKLMLAAYNAGPTAVKRAGGIPANKETRAYVPKVLSEYARLSKFYNGASI